MNSKTENLDLVGVYLQFNSPCLLFQIKSYLGKAHWDFISIQYVIFCAIIYRSDNSL